MSEHTTEEAENGTPRPVDNGEACHRCHGPNVTWCAPSPLWNQVIREGSINGAPLYGDLLCITCFITLAERMGLPSGRRWRLYLDPEPEGLETVTPSGRVWDAERWLWADPVPNDHKATAETAEIADQWDAPLPRYATTVRNGRVKRVRCVCDKRDLCFFHAVQRDGLRVSYAPPGVSVPPAGGDDRG